MKEAVGESSMTLITIVLVAAAIGAIALILSNLLGSQKKRAACEDAGGNFNSGNCYKVGTSGATCGWDEGTESYSCF